MSKSTLISIILCLMLNFNITAEQQLKPIYIFVHGLFDSKKQVLPYEKMLNNQIISFNFDDALYFPYFHRFLLTSFGQESEIEKLNDMYTAIVKYFENKNLIVPPIILIGISRGASLILNFLAYKQPKNIVAVILESPFDSIEIVLENMTKKNYILISKLFSYIFKHYNKDGIQPINCINHINQKIRILFISSYQDQRIPYKHTETLYNIRMQNQNNASHTQLKIFDLGKHGKILKNNFHEYQHIITNFLFTK